MSKTLSQSNIKRLEQTDIEIQKITKEFGLNFFPQEFDVIPSEKMLEILAYRFPVNFSHWTFGRDWEREKTKYEYGFGIPYEVVLNANPSRAYLMTTNPFPVQVMVMAHVYAHNDFVKNNVYFRPTRRDMITSASEDSVKFRQYEKEYSHDRVERIIECGFRIEMNIDPNFFILEESEEQQIERLKRPLRPSEQMTLYAGLVGGKKPEKIDKEALDRKTPPEPTLDLMLYIIQHSPELKEFERDILSVIRKQSQYFMPQRRTKIMNEGWATFWHMRVMKELFKRGLLTNEDHGYYNKYNARVLATNPRMPNPYLMGLKMFEDIEDRWNKGRHGREWEECVDFEKKKRWDTGEDKGREKIFEARRSYSDAFFIDHFLTEKLVEDLNLYTYVSKDTGIEIQYIIDKKDWEVIRRVLRDYFIRLGKSPVIEVEDGDYRGARELYLKHAWEGIPLDSEYRQMTMEAIAFLWRRKVHLETYDPVGTLTKKIYCCEYNRENDDFKHFD